MQYVYWCSSYVDLMMNSGVSVSVTEKDKLLILKKSYKDGALTINEMELRSVAEAICGTPSNTDGMIYTSSKYVDIALRSLNKWVGDETIDARAHSTILKEIYVMVREFKTLSVKLVPLRSSEEMIYKAHAFARHVYRQTQDLMIELNHGVDSIPTQEIYIEKAKFFGAELLKPLTILQFEKKLLAQRKIKSIEVPIHENVISMVDFKK